MTRLVWHGLAAEVLRDARRLIERPENDYSWSSWRDAKEALQEIDGLIEGLRTGSIRSSQIAVLFAPTGPLQELSESNGWGGPFLELADRCDLALEDAEPVVRATYVCAVCGRTAGEIALHGSSERAELRRESFTGSLLAPVSGGDAFAMLHAVLAEGRADAAFGLDPEFAPFYCSACARSYCGDHWDRWDVFDEDVPDWHDSIRGRCPQGHERMLED